jgi:hypothetical protein
MIKSIAVGWHLLFAIIQTLYTIDVAYSYVDDWEITYPKELRFNISWTVHNFSAIDISSFESPIFEPPTSINDHRFKLRILPQFGESKNMVAIFLLWDSPEVEKLEIKYRFRIKGRNGDWTIAPEEQGLFANKFKGWGYENRINRNTLLDPENSYLIKSSITFYADISFWEFVSKNYNFRRVKQLRCDNTDINALDALSAIGKFYNTNKFSDATLVINGRNYSVHRVRLFDFLFILYFHR